MGGTSSSTQRSTQESQTEPWDPAQPALKGILAQLKPMVANAGLTGSQNSAIDQLIAAAQGGNPYANQISGFTSNLLNGGGANDQAGRVSGAFDALNERLTPFANGSMVGNNPGLQAALDVIKNDVGSSINGQFAAAGRDLSGANQQSWARGVTEGMAPVIANQWNQDIRNQLDAANTLYGAGNTTGGILSGLNQQGLANQQQGLTNADAAIAAQNYGPTQTLALEQLRKTLPAESLALLAQIGIPIAGLGGKSQSEGTQTGTQTMSGAQQFATIANGIGSMIPKYPIKIPGIG